MKIYFEGQYTLNPRLLMRRCGFAEIRTKEISYARRLSQYEYPRFHAYLNLTPQGFFVNLHLDQKKPSYGQETAHSGEYDGVLVEAEAQRIKSIIQKLKVQGI